MIACEDTRHTRILLNAYDLKTQMISYHSYNEKVKTDRFIRDLKNGKTVALVSDAGTPGISDPGYVLIKQAIENNIKVEAIPGASAVLNALVLSGKPMHKFIFEGFLSNKSSQRRKRLEHLKAEERTVILYESVHRINKMLADILDIFGDIEIVCAREMTKKFEQIHREKVSEILKHYENTKPKGEFVIVI